MDGSIECRAAKCGSERTSCWTAPAIEIPPVPVLMGPTGSGKTAAAIALARVFPLAAICADLRQTMRGMAIGSAQPSKEEVEILPHRLCGILDPAADITVEDWRKMAVAEIRDVLSEGKIPLVLGGSGLAVKALMEGGEFDAPPAPVLRKALNAAYRDGGLEKLSAAFGPMISGLLKETEAKNPHRVIRAIERFAWAARGGGAPEFAEIETAEIKVAWISQLDEWKRKAATESGPDAANGENCGFEFKIFALYPDRKWLAKRILNRARIMFQNGLLEEVKALLASGVSRDARALKGHGYPEAIAVLDGTMSMEEAIVKTASITRRYAKRQITWLKHQFRDVTFLPVGGDIQPEDAVKPVAGFLAANWTDFLGANRGAQNE